MIEPRQDEALGIVIPLLRQHGLELNCGDLWIACRELRPSAIEHSHRFSTRAASRRPACARRADSGAA